MNTQLESPIGPHTMISGREYDYFSGTGYLGLQSHPAVIQAAKEALDLYGFSTVSSRGGLGEYALYTEFGHQAAGFFQSEKILHFASGYLGISILIQATAHKFDHIFIDKDAHFSLWDALLSCNKEITPFHHLSVDDLCQKLKTELHATERPLVLSDGLFPVSGEIAPLADYLNLVKPLGGQVYLDDAHAVGVLGSDGLGTANYYGISDEACQTSGTLAKALGGFGGILWGESKWINYLDRNSRFLTGSSPLPVPVVAASAKALELARLHPELRLSLEKNVTFLRKGLISLGFTLQQSPSPIICIKSERDLNLDNLQSALFKRGIATTLVRSYPSTPPGGALRIAVFSNHSMEQLQRLINNIKELV